MIIRFQGQYVSGATAVASPLPGIRRMKVNNRGCILASAHRALQPEALCRIERDAGIFEWTMRVQQPGEDATLPCRSRS